MRVDTEVDKNLQARLSIGEYYQIIAPILYIKSFIIDCLSLEAFSSLAAFSVLLNIANSFVNPIVYGTTVSRAFPSRPLPLSTIESQSDTTAGIQRAYYKHV